MLVGSSLVDITPEPGIDLAGFAVRNQPSVAVWDNLFARILYLSNGVTPVILVVFDLIGLMESDVDNLINLIAQKTKVEKNQVLLASTHTHSGLVTVNLNQCGEFLPGYLEPYYESIAKACVDAISNAEECQTGIFSEECDLTSDRRNDATFIDNQIRGIFWKNKKGKIKAILMNYAMHPVCLRDNKISSDYPGMLCNLVTNAYAEKPFSIFVLGSCGNLNPPDVGVSYEQMKTWAGILSEKVQKGMEKNSSTISKKEKIELLKEKIIVPSTTKSLSEMDHFADKLRNHSGAVSEFGEKYNLAIDEWLDRMKKRINSGWDRNIEIDIFILKFNNVFITGISGEIFSSFRNMVNTPKEATLIDISCCGSPVGYLPDENAWRKSGYETETSTFFYNRPGIPRGTLEKIADKINKMIQTL